jgi:hypothetical protein
MARVRRSIAPKALLVAYALCVALLPLGHHDIACHLKSPTHCTTCTASVSGETAAHAVMLSSAQLDDAGRAMVVEASARSFTSLNISSERAPPALG